MGDHTLADTSTSISLNITSSGSDGYAVQRTVADPEKPI